MKKLQALWPMKTVHNKLSRLAQLLRFPQKGRRLRGAAVGLLVAWYLIASLGLVIPAYELPSFETPAEELTSLPSQPTIQLASESSAPAKPNCCGKGAKCCCHSKTTNGGKCCKQNSKNRPVTFEKPNSSEEKFLAWVSCTCGSSSPTVVIVLTEDRLVSQPVKLLSGLPQVDILPTNSFPGPQHGDQPETPPPQATV